jgi:hypothetical protein
MDDGSIEWVNGGVFYLSEWYAKQNGLTADFTARDKFELLSTVYDEKSYYEDTSYIPSYGRDLYDLAKMLLETAFPEGSEGYGEWIIDESLKFVNDITSRSTAPLPRDTIANNLQLVANAGRCVLYQDREGRLRIERINAENTDYEINSFNSYLKPEISLTKPLRQVKVKWYAYGGDNITTEDLSYPLDENIPVGTKGETIIIDNPLLTNSGAVSKVAEWVYSYLKNRTTLDLSWRPDVRLDALDIVKNSNEYNASQVRMTDVELTYNGAFRATGKGKVIGNG